MRQGFILNIPSFILSVTLLLLTSCNYVTPEAENPNPGLEKSSTLYQVKDGLLSLRKSVLGYEISQENNTIKQEKKTWLCGWAPVVQSGGWHGMGGLSNTPETGHCNVEMRITHDGSGLEARLVNLNYPGQFESWQKLFTIPIKQHFYYERDVDSRGRKLNVFKKVTDRKNWKLAPWMDLDLKNIQFEDAYSRPYGFWGGKIGDVFDIEVTNEDDNKNFIAFSGTMTHGVYGSLVQHVYRFNFLEIKDNPNFKKTPYDKRTSKHMNILHILGYQPTGFASQEVDWAAHWDLSQPVEICLNGFPEDARNYGQIGEDVIAEMNKTMEKIGAVAKGQKAFVVSKKKMKYHYDLRCPSISWVDDPNVSFLAPLGIALVNTNIKTGEILWGGAVIWGGLMDYIVNRDSESVVDAMARTTNELLQGVESSKQNPYFEDLSQNLQLNQWSRGFTNLQQLSELTGVAKKSASLTSTQKLVAEQLDKMKDLKDEAQKQAIMMEIVSKLKTLDMVDSINVDGFEIPAFNINDKDVLFDSSMAQIEENNFIDDLTRFAGLSKSIALTKDEQQSKNDVFSSNMTMEKMESLVSNFLNNNHMALDSDNRVENHYDAISVAMSGKTGLEKLEAAKSMIKNVMIHEWGHATGLGHQFEGNRMPERGMVPDYVYDDLAQFVPDRHNYTSVMDYMSGHTEVTLPYDQVKMGYQDELTWRYLYKQEYATYRAGDKDWTYFPLPKNGVIPNETLKDSSIYYARYMPQCSDFDAFLGTSPYCRRWDRGHDAPTIVEENLKEYTDSFISRLNSFTEATGGNPSWANYRLWSATYNLMNYNRTFYDNLRYQLSNNSLYLRVFDRLKKDESALLSFSRACIDPSQSPSNRLAIEFTKLAVKPLPTQPSMTTLEAAQSEMSESQYASLYLKYKSIVGDLNTRSLDDAGFDALEKKLNDKGLAFTEVQKLCRASQKSLSVAKLLLSLKGPDHAIMNYNDSIVPTGLRGAQAKADYSRMFGTYDQLGLLPLKIAALDVLTGTASTLQYGWWRIPKPIYNDPNDGKYGYYSMYPEEFTDIIGTAVKNNMGFGGTQLQDAASMSVANLYMNYFLFRTFFWSNDGQARGFQSNYIEELKAQTKFQVAISPVLLQSIDIPGEPTNKRFGFRPRLFNLAERKMIDLPEAYALPNKKIIVRGNDSQIIFPMTKIRFLSQDSAYVWALDVTYDKTSYDDPLQGFTVKNAISELTTQELDKCIRGAAGLASFFNSNEEFQGFQVDPSIATDPDAQTNFEKSLDAAFDVYQNREGLTPSQIACEESLKGVGLITSTALSLNGYFLPQVYEYIKK